MRSQRSGTSKRHKKIAKPPRCGGPFIGSVPVKAGVADWAGNKNSSVPLAVGNCATCRARARDSAVAFRQHRWELAGTSPCASVAV